MTVQIYLVANNLNDKQYAAKLSEAAKRQWAKVKGVA